MGTPSSSPSASISTSVSTSISSSPSTSASASPSHAVGASQCVYLAEAKEHLRVTHTSDDSMIDSMIDAAIDWVEKYLRRRLLSTTCVDYFDAWPVTIRPRWSALIAVTSIQYVDTGGTTQTLSSDDYDVDTDSEPGRIVPAYNCSWPSIRNEINAITVTYTAGYGTSHDDVPASIRSAILLIVGHLYENREAATEVTLNTIPFGVLQLLGIHRLVEV